MYCNRCGNEIDNSSVFCRFCGTMIEQSHELEVSDVDISVGDVVEHLENASILEKRIFELDNLINNLNSRINNLRAKRSICAPEYDNSLTEYGYYYALIFPIAFIIAYPIAAFNMVDHPILYTIFLYDDVFPCFKIAALAGLIAAGIPTVISLLADIVKYNKEKARYKKDVQRMNRLYNQDLEKAKILEAEKDDLIAKKKQSEQYLQRIYSKNILFPKYRNMVAVITILEYYMSGRCRKLTGHEGAYNIYESELRQNIIISSLDAIRNSLEQIKHNQYMLYQAIQDAQDRISDLSYEFNNISSTMKSLDNNSRVSAYNAKIAADNSKLISYIELIKA